MVLYCLKSKNKVRLEFSSIENAEISYCLGFITGHAKIKYSWGFKLLEMLLDMVRLGSYIAQKENIRYGLGFLS